MRLTIEQARALNIPEHYIAMAEQAERSRAVREDLDLTPAKPNRRGLINGMNKTELAFWQMMAGSRLNLIVACWREPLTFRLAGRTRYTPDFGVRIRGEPFTLVEVKGFMRDDAAVKLKVAADMYPCFRWLLVRRDGRHGWDVREVTRAGIGVHPIAVPWINGGTV
jgi:hypothetical protein